MAPAFCEARPNFGSFGLATELRQGLVAGLQLILGKNPDGPGSVRLRFDGVADVQARQIIAKSVGVGFAA